MWVEMRTRDGGDWVGELDALIYKYSGAGGRHSKGAEDWL